MKWFRTHIRNGSRLALVALAVQLVLSFGHFHADPARAAGTATVSVQLPDNTSHAPDQHPADACAICAVMAQAGTVLAATPPVLPLPQAAAFLRPAATAGFTHLDAFSGPFQPRAPPLS